MQDVAEIARKSDDNMRQSAIRLPSDLRKRLERAGGHRGVGAEIRRRLEASFEAEKAPANAKTRDLIEAVTFLADKADFYYGDWSTSASGFDVLSAGLRLFLAARQPEAGAQPDADASDLFFDPNSTPESIARFILADLMWVKREEKKLR